VDGVRWTVDGTAVEVTAATIVEGEPAVGDTVSVTARQEGEVWTALRIVRESGPAAVPVTFSGTLEAFDARTWVVDRRVVTIDRETRIVGEPWVGATVDVDAVELGGRLLGRELRVGSPRPTETRPPRASPPPRSTPEPGLPPTRARR
jgi:hypothetical protein